MGRIVVRKAGYPFAQIQGAGVTQYSDCWICDSPTLMTMPQVLAISGIPQEGISLYPDDRNAVCNLVEVTRPNEGKIIRGGVGYYHYEIRATYRTDVDPWQSNPDPLQRNPRFSIIAQKNQVYKFKDLADRPFVNPVGDPFDPPPPIEEVETILRVSVNTARYKKSDAEQYANTVNNSSWNGFAAKCVKLVTLSGTYKYENGTHYWERQYEFHIRPSSHPWHPYQQLNMGLRYFKAANDNNPRLVDDEDGTKAAIPVLLRADGCRIKPADLVGSPPVQPSYTDFKLYNLIDFSVFNITLPPEAFD